MFLPIILVLGYIFGTIYYANVVTRDGLTLTHRDARLTRALLQAAGWITGLAGLFMIFATVALQTVDETEQPVPEVSGVMVFAGVLIVAACAGGIFLTVGSPDFRVWLSKHLERIGGAFNPESPIQVTAVVMTLLMVAMTMVLFLVQGGQEGVEQATTEISVDGLVLQNVLFLAVAALGVGYAIRRDDGGTLKRLGLRWPTREDWRWGIGSGVAFYFVLIIVAGILSFFIGDLNNEAASNQAEALAAIPLIPLFFATTLVAIAEEIFFRGALQPVFGNLITTLVFAFLHTQSLLSPLIIVLIGLSYMLGILRDRYSTTAAIIAHFCYNMIQLLLQIAVTTGT